MKIWRYNRFDAMLLILSILQLFILFYLLNNWAFLGKIGKISGFLLVVFFTTYNIIIISHLFTHTPWFNSVWMNRLVSMINSINIGQSVQAYQLTHVRNHHRYNNDRKGVNGKTLDESSTFRCGKEGEHTSIWHYAVLGALSTLVNIFKYNIWSIFRLWRVGSHESNLLSLVSRGVAKKQWELRQLQLDRFAYCMSLLIFLLVSWKWTLFCYFPAFFISLVLVNIQNYYEHFGAFPDSKMANSVSYYGKIYNFLTFNDGYHQEHHLFAAGHWSKMPKTREIYFSSNEDCERIISPVPAIIGFVDKNRKMLHRQPKKLDIDLTYTKQEVNLS